MADMDLPTVFEYDVMAMGVRGAVGYGRQRHAFGASGTVRRKVIFACAMGLLVATLSTASLSAAVFRVDGVTGSDGPGCGSEVSPCATIQRAVDLASSGDTILVSEGTYTDNVDCIGSPTVVCVFQKELTILGGFGSGNWSLPDPSTNTTVIDGQNTRRGVIARRGGPDPGLPATSLRMEGFTVRRGRVVGSPHGLGGGLQANFTDVVLRDMVFEDNEARGGAGGIGGGGGAAIQANADAGTTATLERVLFRNNRATGGAGTGGVGQGGGLLVDHAALTGLALEFRNNTATGGASATVGRDALGGAASLSFGSQGALVRVIATGNQAVGGTASNSGGHSFGGGIYLEGAESPAADRTEIEIFDSQLSGNTSLGGDSSTAGGGVGGAIAAFGAQLRLERSSVIGNRGEGGVGASTTGNAAGGGVFLEWPFGSPAPLNTIRNSIIAENVIDGTAGGGGGLRLLGAEALVSHVTFADNRLLDVGFGLGILVGPFAQGPVVQPGELILSYSILADHTVASSGRALHVQATAAAASTADLGDRNLFVGNSNDTNEGRPNSGTYVGFPGSNIFDSNPSTFFVGPNTSDYHVDGTQPPTNSATGSSEPLDLDGATRSGSRDLGADEVGAVAFGLSVSKLGVGSGTVTSSPAGIQCGVDCFESYNENTSVDLTPTPGADSSFTGWSGTADCSDGTVLMTQDLQCTAQFEGMGASPMCSVGVEDLVLTDETVSTAATEAACNSIIAGPSYTVAASGDVTFESPTIILRNGFTVSGSFVGVNVTP